MIALAVAAVAESVADKVPVVDHALDAVQTLIRPLAGALAVAGTQAHLDPVTAGVLGLVLGAPLAGGLHAAKGGARLASTAATAGVANPVLSLAEDITALGQSLLGIFVPALGAVFALLLFYGAWRLWRRLRRTRKEPSVGTGQGKTG